ncbi:hypothetical protein SK128_002824, partial [Halocaridina rubra]
YLPQISSGVIFEVVDFIGITTQGLLPPFPYAQMGGEDIKKWHFWSRDRYLLVENQLLYPWR